ncbi:LytR/AlgR family response regulator transcription factor [Algoriphagus halophilus]|uniref:Two component transcriptional regulator, LytTR family n=1 Tax=Algoriphagus halophilus TaxID=226505 RepID=A0A1N6DTQ7_9BACT|nr:LytTR family DNA-binding domain-containing protein [Algoriphagus halophilus]SIN74093.1 two component transcriptional regulator, LytTR family [Algoriphagus halophilus]
MIKAIAIDDEKMALEVIKAHASKVPFLHLEEVFLDAIQALEYMKTNSIDLIFLDINMPDISGIDFAELLPKETMVVFTTAYSDFAVKGFELDALDYLLKPFNLPRFIKACQKAQEWLELQPGKEPEFTFIKTGEGQIRLVFEELLFCEANGNYVTFQLENEKAMSRMTLAEVEHLLPSFFIRSHRSFLVNSKKVDKVEKHVLHLGERSVPVSLSYMDQVLEFFNQ